MHRDEPLSILLVDDSEFFTSLLSDKLEASYQMQVVTTVNAADAMAALADRSFDCIVSDYEMPETSGLEFFEMVDGQHDVPFILLTAQGGEEVASRAIRMGIDEYLLKQSVRDDEPMELLVNRIRNVVEQRRAERKYEQLVDNSPDEIGQVAVDGTILAANEAMSTAYGVDRDELLGETLETYLPADVADQRLEHGKRALTAGSAVTFQDSIGVRHFHNIAVPVSSPGDRESIQLVTRDITLQKRTEQQLERKSEKLALINRIVRHDINNDVQLLMSWSDCLAEHVEEDGTDYVERIGQTSSHIAELTAIARDFVDSMEDGQEIDLEPIQLDRLLATEIEKLRARDDATVGADELPAVSVLANELLSSVFTNLLTNAIRHNDSADPEVRVTVEETDETVTVSVADNGPGVPDDRKADMFGKGDMGPESPGTGVGLYLAHTLVEQYGGDIWVEDNEPRGAVFTVELPTAPAATTA
jgi:PAS domain S-box-containing protein